MKKVNDVFFRNKFLLILFVIIIALTKTTGIIHSQITGEALDLASKNNMDKFLMTIIYLIIATCILIFMRFLSKYFENKYKKEIMINIKTALFSSMIEKKIKCVKESNLSEEFSSFINNMSMAENNYFYAITEAIILGINYFITIMAFIYISPIIALVVALISIIPLIIPLTLKSKLEKRTSIFIHEYSNFTGRIKEYLSGYEIIRGFSLESKILQAFDENSKKIEKLKQNSESFTEFVNGSSLVASFFVVAGTLTTGMFLALNGKMNFGQIIALTMVSGGISDAASGFGKNITSIRSAMPIVNRFNENLLNKYVVTKKEINNNLVSNIKVENLNIKFQDKIILEDINVEFKSSKKYALVGESGSGKSTLLNSLLSYNDYTGNIFFGNNELREFEERNIFNIVSYVTQKPVIIEGSIRDNLNFYDNYSDEELNDMLDKIYLTDKINSLENGIDTYIDDNTLSGGEKQRINIGRCLIRKKPFIFLDEYTSALDSITSLAIERYLLSLENICVISVTHRLNKHILNMYDEIILLNDGKILEKGNFQDLVKVRGYFYNLFNSYSKHM